MIVDSHCHLDFSKFKDIGFKNYDPEIHNMPAVLKRAHDEGVTHLLAIGTTLKDSADNIDVSRGTFSINSASVPRGTWPKIYAAVGIHPDYAKETIEKIGLDYTIESLSKMSEEKEVVCIGECGIDYRNGQADRKEQLAVFEAQCELSKKCGLPLEIHSRMGESDIIAVLKNGDYRGVIHCFSGTMPFAKQALDIGFMVSFSGIVTFKNAKEVQAVAQYIPDDRLLIETDAPFLAPTPFRGRVNEPAFVKKTAEFVADLRGTTTEEIYRITAQNFFNMFNKAVA